MEVEHFSHPDHPLILINQVLEYVGEHVICSGCEEPISGPCYSCTSCYFFLHKKCAELPGEIRRPLHPQHPLLLLAKPPYHGRCLCDLCDKTCESFVYHCSLCKFDLDIKCALPRCFFELEGQGHNFICLQKPFPLKSFSFTCNACGTDGDDNAYMCTICQLMVHEHCTSLKQALYSNRKKKQALYSNQRIKHFSHPHHPLILINQMPEYVGEQVICFGCEEPISGPCYSCPSCSFFLHNKCAELPREIRRHWHPEHPLILLAHPPFDDDCSAEYLCDLCNKTGNSFVYHCFDCKFDLDSQCAFPPCVDEAYQDQRHQFKCLLKSLPLKSFSFTCNACGTDGDDTPYMCTTCQLMVHKRCTSLKQTLKIRQHPHLLTFTYFLQEDESGKPNCGVCQIQFKSGHGGYSCKDCNFFAHVNCTREFKVIGSDTCIATNDESMDSSTCNSQQIEHFSHEHSLTLMGEFNNNMKCEGCMLPISNPFYGCTQCNFFLHKACGELPRQLQLQEETLTLLPRADTEDGTFRCGFCGQYFHGFMYESDARSKFSFDVRCGINASLGTITHESHEHALFLSDGYEVRCCSACGKDCRQILFRCAICDFNLDHRCATLPREARHEYDEHPLFLTYTDPNDYQFVCQICEKERDPKLWFYRCEECDFDAHPECALGKCPYIKLGGSYTYGFHPHPLALVEKTEDYPPCHSCGEPCDDLALECTHSQCSFITHRKRWRCFYALYKK